jgi:hypothetical protein
MLPIDIGVYIDCSSAQTAGLASRCLAVGPQSGAKENFDCTFYYITFNSSREAQKATKNLKKCRS